ncbi:MAG: hypothetical protein OEY14_11395, partial [Myxococcales bacterium]|nr:hypothetical protein [Myxococcales bacterium]
LLERVAEAISARGLGAPALLMLESMRPLGVFASQAMLFVSPLISPLMGLGEYARLQRLLERPAGFEALLSAIEASTERRGSSRS